MKNVKYVLGLLAFVALLFTAKPAYAQENPFFGSLNNYRDFLTQIYNACEAGNMALAKSYDGSDEANAIVEAMYAAGITDFYIIMNGTTDTGKGIGIHTKPDWGYGFYYGDFVAGKYEGNGTFFYNTGFEDPSGIYYYSYNGQWVNNLPNGAGEIRFADKCYGDDLITNFLYKGNFVNGYANGEMQMSCIQGYAYYPSLFLFNATLGKVSPSSVAIVNPDVYFRFLADIETFNAEGLIPFEFIDLDGIKRISFASGYDDFTSVYQSDLSMQQWAAETNDTVYTICATVNYNYDPTNPDDRPCFYDYWQASADYRFGVYMFME